MLSTHFLSLTKTSVFSDLCIHLFGKGNKCDVLAFQCRCRTFYSLEDLGLSQFSELSKEGKGVRDQDEL